MLKKLFSPVASVLAIGLVVLLVLGWHFSSALSTNQPVSEPLQLPGTRPIINDPAHHAVFSCLIKNPAPTAVGEPTTLRLYLDSGGDIYPPAEFLPANPTDIRWPGGKNNPNTEADLQWYFDRVANQATRDKVFARYAVTKPQKLGSRRTGRHYLTPYDTVAWDNLRTAMARQLANQINTATDNGKKPLVVLIHGYNVGDYEHALASPCGPTKRTRTLTYYEAIRKKLLALRPKLKDAVWLEVYWDGLQDNDITINSMRIWGAAQASARYAGLGLREVLRQTDVQTPIRVFTHSAGGLVISQALWNNDAFIGIAYENQLKGMMKHIPTLAHQDVRVGMLVPALTSEAFTYYYTRTTSAHQVVTADNPIYRIVVGQNHRDLPINRGPLGCNLAGATCMGSGSEGFAYGRMRLGKHSEALQRVDFCVTPPGGAPPKEFRALLGFEKHDWPLYFERHPIAKPNDPPIMVAFLQQVLD